MNVLNLQWRYRAENIFNDMDKTDRKSKHMRCLRKNKFNIEIICHAWIHKRSTKTQLFGTKWLFSMFFVSCVAVAALNDNESNHSKNDWTSSESSSTNGFTWFHDLIDVVCRFSTCHFDRIWLRIYLVFLCVFFYWFDFKIYDILIKSHYKFFFLYIFRLIHKWIQNELLRSIRSN